MLAPKFLSWMALMKAMISPKRKLYEPHDGQAVHPHLLHVQLRVAPAQGAGPPDHPAQGQDQGAHEADDLGHVVDELVGGLADDRQVAAGGAFGLGGQGRQLAGADDVHHPLGPLAEPPQAHRELGLVGLHAQHVQGP